MFQHGGGGDGAERDIADYSQRIHADTQHRQVVRRGAGEHGDNPGDEVIVPHLFVDDAGAPGVDDQQPAAIDERDVGAQQIKREKRPDDRGFAVPHHLHILDHQAHRNQRQYCHEGYKQRIEKILVGPEAGKRDDKPEEKNRGGQYRREDELFPYQRRLDVGSGAHHEDEKAPQSHKDQEQGKGLAGDVTLAADHQDDNQRQAEDHFNYRYHEVWLQTQLPINNSPGKLPSPGNGHAGLFHRINQPGDNIIRGVHLRGLAERQLRAVPFHFTVIVPERAGT